MTAQVDSETIVGTNGFTSVASVVIECCENPHLESESPMVQMNGSDIEDMGPKNVKDTSFYRYVSDGGADDRPVNRIDYRDASTHDNGIGGPLLEYIWCDEALSGQNLYLGGDLGSDGAIYFIPGHAPRVMRLDPLTNTASLIGPTLTGKYKWLRGVAVEGTKPAPAPTGQQQGGQTIYALPCHTTTVLKIHVPTQQITELPIAYDEFFRSIYPDEAATATEKAASERNQPWKYHGGNVSPVDGCIYAIPQSARYVLKVDPTTDLCTLVGPALPGRYKWYGGVVGQADGAIYGIPHNASAVLRIHPVDGVTLHGDYGTGGHKWHGAAAAPNGVIVGVAANADTVLCITPTASSPSPILTELRGPHATGALQSGRHRIDNKYKFLGANAGPDGRVYCFPCAAERVLAVDTVAMTVSEVGPNIYDAKLERLCQNKWQNGVHVVSATTNHNCIFGIPLAGESLLHIEFSQYMRGEGDIQVITWPIPAPHHCLGKWEGAVLASNGVVYTIPNNHKASLRIELPRCHLADAASGETEQLNDGTPTVTLSTAAADVIATSTDTSTSGTSQTSTTTTTHKTDRPDYSHVEGLVYKSGIPTLRASAHRVKYSLKNRKHDPKPRNAFGIETGTLWLPPTVCQEDVLRYDSTSFDMRGAMEALLQRCDPDLVGRFRDGSDRLEDFVVPAPSTWRVVNGGQVEVAQKVLSDAVANDAAFMSMFHRLVTKVVLPYMKKRLCVAGASDSDSPITFYYQTPPTVRLQPGPAWAQVKPHTDTEYGHQTGELNFWLPLTDRSTGVDLWCESKFMADDYHPIPAVLGEIIAFHGSSCRHYVNTNSTTYTRVSFDFRVGVQGFFDPTWEMQGTNDDHSRREFTV